MKLPLKNLKPVVIAATVLLTLSQSVFAQSDAQDCPYVHDKVSLSIDDATVKSGQPARVHITSDVDVHYVYGGANSFILEKHRILNEHHDITKELHNVMGPGDSYKAHEDSYLDYGSGLAVGSYYVGYRIYIPARECNLRVGATLKVE